MMPPALSSSLQVDGYFVMRDPLVLPAQCLPGGSSATARS